MRSCCALSSLALSRPGLGGSINERFFDREASGLIGFDWGGISSQSEPDISSFFKKNGQSVISMLIDSLASTADIGTGDDFMTGPITSLRGRTRRFREGVEDPDVLAFENSLKKVQLSE